MKLKDKETGETIEAEFWLVKIEDGKGKVIQRFKSNDDVEKLDRWEEVRDGSNL